MGGQLVFSSDVHRDDESASFFDRFPLSAGSSPLPLLLGRAAKTAPSTRRHVVVRFMCAPFTAVFRMECARASSSDDELSDDKDGMENGKARRPRLEELLRMEEAPPSCPDELKTPQDTAVSCYLKEHAIVLFGLTDSTGISCALKEEPLSLPKGHCDVDGGDEMQMAIVPVNVDVGGSATASPGAPVSASLRRVLLQAMGRTKGRYWKLVDGSRAAGNKKPELFYQRPIPMGRRCRVQHLEESPYV